MGGICEKVLNEKKMKSAHYELPIDNNDKKEDNSYNLQNRFLNVNYESCSNVNLNSSLFQVNPENTKMSLKARKNRSRSVVPKKKSKEHELSQGNEKSRSKKSMISDLRSYRKKTNNEELQRSLHDFQDSYLNSSSFIQKDFSLLLVEEINKLRNNCFNYARRIDYYSKFINKYEGNNCLIIKLEQIFAHIILVKGEPEFKNASLYLKKFYEENPNSKLNKLEEIEELKIPFPEKELDRIKDMRYLDFQVNKLKRKFKDKYEITGYHLDITYKDAEIATVMQIVDDNYGHKKRRRNLLNENSKYVGINIKKLKKDRYAIYYVFAK